MLPSADLADLVFSVVIGVEWRNKVDGNYARSDRLFNLTKLLAAHVQCVVTPPDFDAG